jgi:hypothetical protein
VGLAPPPVEAWSSAAFPAAAAVTLPGDLWIEAGQAKLAEGFVVQNPKFVLRFDNGLIFLDHARGTLSGAAVTAQGTLRRSGRSVSLAGKFGFSDAAAFAGGKGDGEIEFTALGDSPALLVAALNGAGHLKFRDLTLPALSRTAFTDLAAQRDQAGVLSRTMLTERLRSEVRETLALPPGETRLTLAGGVLRAGPMPLTDGVHAITAGAAFDFRNLTAAGRMTYAARSAPKGWTGPPPQAVLNWRGVPGKPVLEVEADEFANGLTALAIHRETERIEGLEQDQRERSFFNRRLKASEDEKRIAAEARRLEEMARLQAERQQRLRAEEAARAAVPQPLLIPLSPPIQLLPPVAR